MRKLFRWVIRVVVVLFALTLLSILLSNVIVEVSTRNKVFNSTDDIPYNKVGLLLGTGKILSGGQLNLFYKYRIEAAVKLYKAGKISFILVSGDNSTKNYNEPKTIKADLVAQGVPKERIFLDYAGFRTLDSVVRSKEIFQQESITLISQQFHNERGIFIAAFKGIKAVGFNAQDVKSGGGVKTKIRERFARVKMMMDLLFGKQPKFLGEKITIE
jgi:SanA protein